MADLRAVSVDMLPVFSFGCRSTDTEAMNVVEVIKEVQEICNAGCLDVILISATFYNII